MQVNEIRDYIERAPKRKYFNGSTIVWNTHARLKWLADLARGSIDDRINRRNGIVDKWEPWKPSVVLKSIQRHHRRKSIIRGIRIPH